MVKGEKRYLHLTYNETYTGRNDKHIIWSPIVLHLNPPENPYCDTVELKFDDDVILGGTLFLLVVRHSDGDTFGIEYGCVHLEGIYDDINRAYEIKKKIEDDKYNDGGYSPWDGYFAKLENVEIYCLVVYN